MSQSVGRAARRRAERDAPLLGVGDEIVRDAIEDTQRSFRGSQGTIPVRLVNVEQVQILGAGIQALVTVELPDGAASWSFVLSPEDAAGAARLLGPIGDHGKSGLFVVK